MTYSNFARRKGSKNKNKKPNTALANAGKVALGAGLATAFLKRDKLGALGANVAERATNAVKAGASLGAAGVDMAKKSAGKTARRVKRQVAVAGEKVKRMTGMSKSNRKPTSSVRSRRDGPRQINID